MAVPTTTLWKRAPHTAAKHKVLGRYYDAWFPILLQSRHFEGVTVLEGFAGPGEYAGGEPGSPLVAMRSVLARQELLDRGKPIRFAFLEGNRRRAEHLRMVIDRELGKLPANVSVEVRHGRCESDALKLLTAVGAWGQPIFANLDPFDACVPLSVVRRLGRNRATEVFVTFMSRRLQRVAKLTNLRQGDEMFGSPAWREVQHQPSAAATEAFLVDAYRETLRRCGFAHLAGFRLSDRRKRAFWLLYGTSSSKGLERMKDAMWKVDPVDGVSFRDPRDPLQGQLDLSHAWLPNLGPLKRQLEVVLAKRGRATIGELCDFALFETSYRAPHATDAVRELIASGAVARDPDRGRLSHRTLVWLVAEESSPLFEL